MSRAHTTDILAEDAGFFVADLDNGGVRFGVKGRVCVDFPAGHPVAADAQALARAADFGSAAGDFVDMLVESGRLDPRSLAG